MSTAAQPSFNECQLVAAECKGLSGAASTGCREHTLNCTAYEPDRSRGKCSLHRFQMLLRIPLALMGIAAKI